MSLLVNEIENFPDVGWVTLEDEERTRSEREKNLLATGTGNEFYVSREIN